MYLLGPEDNQYGNIRVAWTPEKEQQLQKSAAGRKLHQLFVPGDKDLTVQAYGRPGNAVILTARDYFERPEEIARNANSVLLIEGEGIADLTLYKAENGMLQMMPKEKMPLVFQNRFVKAPLQDDNVEHLISDIRHTLTISPEDLEFFVRKELG